MYQKKGKEKKSIWIDHDYLVSALTALTALKDESDTAGTMAIVCSVGGKERILHKISGK